MRLVYQEIELPLIENNYFSILSIENSDLFVKIQSNLVEQLEGFDGPLCLSEDSDTLSISENLEFIHSPWLINLDNKIFTNPLHKEITIDARESGAEDSINRIILELMSKMSVIVSEFDSVIGLDNAINLSDILKLLKVKFNLDEYEKFLEKLQQYMIKVVEYTNIKVFIFNQLLAYLNVKEIMELQRFAKEEEIYILLMERELFFENKYGFPILVVDKDLCEIYN